jgi:hypothetical protein
LRTINRLTEGDTVRYSPILRSGEKRSGEVTLVVAPAIPESKEKPIVVFDPKPAEKTAEWKISRKVSVAIFIYGPDGLNEGKVKTLLAKDTDLVAQLADYAERTDQTEALIQALTSGGSPATMDAALQGFASQYGLSGKIDRTQAPDQQALTLFRTLNPAIQTYDPLAPASSQRVGETASLATSIAGLFFGSPVGVAAGGTALVIDLKMLAFPKTDFRSSLAEKLPGEGLGLCGKKDPAPPHTKVAYLWAARIPNTKAPTLTIGNENSIPITQKSPIGVEVSDADWKYVDRIRNWTLTADGRKPVPVTIKKLSEPKQLEIDLTNTSISPGTYSLHANWDWDSFDINGEVRIQPLGDFGGARLDPVSQDQLIAGRGEVRISLEGADFEFVTGVQFQRQKDEFAKPAPLPFVLPSGLRRGPQQHIDLLVDTKDIEPGAYQFLVTQVDGRTHPVPFWILPEPPQITNLPFVISRGERTHQFTLKGENLDLLTKLEVPKGSIALGPKLPKQAERAATLQLTDDLEPGSALPILASVAGHTDAIKIENAVHVVGPRPVIKEVKVSAPSDMPIAIRPGELQAGVYFSGMFHVKDLETNSGIQLSCDGQEGNVVTLKLGTHSGSATFEQLGADQVFLSFDTNGWPAGCNVQARIDNGPDGLSDPWLLGRLVRFPQVDSFKVVSTETPIPTSTPHTPGYVGELIGTDLQNIEKIGWDSTNCTTVTDLPAPIPGAGLKQSLRISLSGPPPAPHTPLYLWLRGDNEGRSTNIHD